MINPDDRCDADDRPDDWDWFESPIDTTAIPLGQLEYIGAFDPARPLALEAYLTPVIRCLKRTSEGKLRCTAIRQLQHSLRRRSVTLPAIQQAALGEILALDGAARPFGTQIRVHRRDAAQAEGHHLRLHVSDDRSMCLPFAEIRSRQSALAALIDQRAPCPDSVSFYVLEDDRRTVAIQTGAILRACYFPSALRHHLAGDARDGRFSSDTCIFDGFTFGRPKRYYYIARAVRNIARAEHEVSQIIPRALAYFRLHRTFAPLLLRPPFTGPTDVMGRAIRHEVGGRELVLFVSSVRFASLLGEAIISASFMNHDEFPFAPSLYRCSGLRNAGGIQYPKRARITTSALCDPRIFHDIEQRVALELGDDLGVRPPVSAAVDFRNWCAASLGGKCPDAPDSWRQYPKR